VIYYKIREVSRIGQMEATAGNTKQLYKLVMQLTIAEQLTFS
jgi:hypothetical protein